MYGNVFLNCPCFFRLQWIVQLNFDKGDEISWENVDVTLPRTDKFASMVRKGISHSLRHQLWMRFAGMLYALFFNQLLEI